MKVHVTDLKPGDRLQTDTYNELGLHVLQKGIHLQSEEISKLMQHGVNYVDIEPTAEEESSDLAPYFQELLLRTKPHLENAVNGFESLYLESIASGKFNNTVVDDILEPLIDQLKEHKDVVSLMLAVNHEDDYTYNHSMQVSVLSYYIATWLGYSKEEAYAAGRAGYLHDIGKCMIPGSLLNKPGKLTAEEYEEMKRHTTYGYDIIRRSTPDDHISALVAIQHHERDDRSGYPHAHGEQDVHPFSQITAVADVFSAMTTNRVYQSKQELLAVLRELNSLSFGKLSAKPTQAFIRHMLPNFIGKRVLLTSGESGIIVMTNPADFFRPLIQTEDRFADLSTERELEIEQIYM